MVEVIYNGTDESIVSNEEISVQIEGQKLIASSSVYNSAVKETNGEVVTIDVPIYFFGNPQLIDGEIPLIDTIGFFKPPTERITFSLRLRRNI